MKFYQATTVNSTIDLDEADKIISLGLKLQSVEIIISDHIRERSRVTLLNDINHLEVPKIIDAILDSMEIGENVNYNVGYKFVV